MAAKISNALEKAATTAPNFVPLFLRTSKPSQRRGHSPQFLLVSLSGMHEDLQRKYLEQLSAPLDGVRAVVIPVPLALARPVVLPSPSQANISIEKSEKAHNNNDDDDDDMVGENGSAQFAQEELRAGALRPAITCCGLASRTPSPPPPKMPTGFV